MEIILCKTDSSFPYFNKFNLFILLLYGLLGTLKVMKHFYIFLLLGGIFFVLNPAPVFAQTTWQNCTQNGIATLRCIPLVINNIVNASMIFAGVVAIFFIILSGIKLMLSGGDQVAVEKAKKTLTFAIMGLVIISLAFAIINFVGSRVGFTPLDINI